MNCPKCRQVEMQPERSGDVPCERCSACNGMFYELAELQRVVRDDLGVRDSLFFTAQSDMMDFIPAHCFRCATDMTPRLLQGVRIDECPRCKGVFLDQGEVASLRFQAR